VMDQIVEQHQRRGTDQGDGALRAPRQRRRMG